jgi:hypothetical protein
MAASKEELAAAALWSPAPSWADLIAFVRSVAPPTCELLAEQKHAGFVLHSDASRLEDTSVESLWLCATYRRTGAIAEDSLTLARQPDGSLPRYMQALQAVFATCTNAMGHDGYSRMDLAPSAEEARILDALAVEEDPAAQKCRVVRTPRRCRVPYDTRPHSRA